MHAGSRVRSGDACMPAAADACVRARGVRTPYSLYLMNATPLKRYTSQILSYKIFSFCEQILKIGANDASGKMLQYAL
jgi:hypothetical protein